MARRAGGSMRDAQSLLEQLLASGSPRLTVEVVHTLLGTPSDERLLALLEALADRDPAAALSLLDQAAAEGVQPTDLLAGVLEFLRDAMVLSVGAGAVLWPSRPGRGRGSRGSSIAGRSTRSWPPSRSSPKPVPGCEAFLTADCSRNWLWSVLPGSRT